MAPEDLALEHPKDADAFWERLSAVLTDEVILAEAVAVGMDWPEVARGQELLVTARRVLVRQAVARRWVSRDTAKPFIVADPHEALAAARPWIEEAQARALAAGVKPHLALVEA